MTRKCLSESSADPPGRTRPTRPAPRQIKVYVTGTHLASGRLCLHAHCMFVIMLRVVFARLRTGCGAGRLAAAPGGTREALGRQVLGEDGGRVMGKDLVFPLARGSIVALVSVPVTGCQTVAPAAASEKEIAGCAYLRPSSLC